MSEVKVTSQLDYKAKAFLHPSYTFQKVIPSSGAQNVNITLAGGDIEIFMDIPSMKVFNPSESVLAWDLNLEKQGGANASWIPADTVPELRVIELLTTDGAKIASVEDVNVYLQLIRRKETPLHEVMTMDKTDCLLPCNVAAASNYTASGVAADRAYVEPQYLLGTALDGGPTYHRKLKLGYILNTFFAKNKDIVFPQVVRLRLVFNGGRVGWMSTSATDPTAGVAVLPVDFKANAINKLTLYLAAESNSDIAKGVIDKVAGGMQIPINYVWRFKTPLAAADYQTVSLRIGSSHGRTLQKIIHAVYNSVESKSTMYDHNNYGADDTKAAKVTQYYIQIDSNKTTQFDINCSYTLGEDWLLHRNRLKGSAIPSQKSYNINHFVEEDFTNSGSPDHEDNKDETLIKGLDLSVERKYDFVGSVMVSAAYNHYDFVIVQRLLTISPNLISVA